MIKRCLNLRVISSGPYSALKSSGVLVLPSERTLRDYTNWIKAVIDAVDKQLMYEAKMSTLPGILYACFLMKTE